MPDLLSSCSMTARHMPLCARKSASSSQTSLTLYPPWRAWRYICLPPHQHCTLHTVTTNCEPWIDTRPCGSGAPSPMPLVWGPRGASRPLPFAAPGSSTRRWCKRGREPTGMPLHCTREGWVVGRSEAHTCVMCCVVTARVGGGSSSVATRQLPGGAAGRWARLWRALCPHLW